MTDISKYIRGVRLKLGVTQAQLAEKIQKKRADIAKYETGVSIPPGDILLKIQQLESTKQKEVHREQS